MKEDVLNWLLADKSLNSAIILYSRYGRSANIKRALNTGLKGTLKELVFNEFAQILDITRSNFDDKLKMEPKLVKIPVPEPEKPTIKYVDIPVSAQKKLREEFPFLQDKSCPNEFKILLSDRITAYHGYVKAHTQLLNCKNDQELRDTANELIGDYLLNRQIHDELTHYQKTGVILGKHPIFARKKALDKLNDTKIIDFPKKQRSILENIRRNQKLVDNSPDSQLTRHRMERIVNYKWELQQLEILMQTRK